MLVAWSWNVFKLVDSLDDFPTNTMSWTNDVDSALIKNLGSASYFACIVYVYESTTT